MFSLKKDAVWNFGQIQCLCPFWPVNQKVIRRFATNQIQPSLVELAEFVAHSSVEAKTEH